MNRLAIFAASAALCAAAVNATEGPGFERISLEVSHHETALRGAIWYPPGTGGESLRLGENAVFAGVPVREGAAVAAGRHPVVLLSHGLGGRFKTLAWLPTGLAERGAVVVAVNHPKSTTWDFDLRQAADHWTRIQDLQAALDYVLDDARWSRSVDESSIAAVGFSYGGWTALSMGGVTGNLDGFVRYCERYGDRESDCRDLARAGIDPRDLDADLWDASYKDERISAVAAIDPGLLHGLDAGNVTNLVDDVLLIGLGEGADRYLATDFGPFGSGFSTLLPGATTEVIAPAHHFTALLPCKPEGPAILRADGDDPVCDDPEGTDRNAVHRRIVSLIAAQLGLVGGV